MPEVAREAIEMAGGDADTAVPARRRTVSATTRSLVSSSRSRSVSGSPGASKSSTPRSTASPRAALSHSHKTASVSTSGDGEETSGTVITSGRIITRAPGRPSAEPSAPMLRTRLRKSPPKRKAAMMQIRSQAMSSATIHASRARLSLMVRPTPPRIEPTSVAAVSSCVIRYIRIKATSAKWIRCVRIGTVVTRQARVRRKVAAPRPGVGASSRRRKATHAATRSPIRALERAVNRGDGGGPYPERFVRVFHLDAYRKARREPDPVQRPLDARQPVDAGAILRQYGPSQADDRAAEVPPGMRLEIDVHGRAGGNVPELCLAEVGHHVPVGDVDEREDFGARAGKGPDGDVEVDDPAVEGSLYPGVLEVQFRGAHRRLGGRQPCVRARLLSNVVLRTRPVTLRLLESGLGGNVLGSRRREGRQGRPLLGACLIEPRVGGENGRPRLLYGHGGRDPLRSGVLHPVLGHELAREQRLEAAQVVPGLLELGLRAAQSCLRRHPDSQPLDLLPRQRERGLRLRESNLVGARVDQEEEIPLLDLLIVPDAKLDDVPVDLWCDANEVGADRGIVRLRPRLPLQQRHDHGDDGSADNARPDQSTKDAAAA